MSLTFSALIVGLMTILTAGFGALFSLLHRADFAIALSFVSSISLVILGRILVGHYTNFTVVFLGFSALYGLSGPIAAQYGEGLPPVFPTPYLTEEFLFCYSLAILGMVFGLWFVASLRSAKRSDMRIRGYNTTALLSTSYLFSLAASLMEIVNFWRVGGFQTLFAGKAVYQSAVADLTGTLPSIQVMLLSAALLGLSFSISHTDLSNGKMKIRHYLPRVFVWVVLGLPLILSLLLLGRRGPLLSLIVVLFVGLFYARPIRTLRLKWIAVGLIVYMALGFLYGARSYVAPALASGDWSRLLERIGTAEFWITSLNPARNEFGAPFGNFNTYILYGGSGLRWGETYLIGFAEPIPRFIWPNKPKTVTYEFRDTFFPDWAERGRIAGTAYSSILEAYVNFGQVGVFVVYTVVGFFLGLLEVRRAGSGSLGYATFYLTLLPVSISFHRSSFGLPLLWPLVLSVSAVMTYTFITAIVCGWRRHSTCVESNGH